MYIVITAELSPYFVNSKRPWNGDGSTLCRDWWGWNGSLAGIEM